MIEQSRVKRIHFVGVGGAGMSGIAEVMHNMGFQISGSDLAENEMVRRFRDLGMMIHIGHHADHIRDAEVVVYSSAVTMKNEEVKEALLRKIPVIPRAEMLAELMRMKFSVAVGGTHGKTTTTSMIASIFNQAGLDPTYVVGGKLKTGGLGAKLGSSRFLVAEADESDGSFMKLLPTIAVVTNIENDHMEYYRTMNRLRSGFAEFANKVPFYGAVILNLDSPNARRILPQINKKVITYGLKNPADIRALSPSYNSFSSSFHLEVQGRSLGNVKLGVGGIHNISNSLAAIGAALETGVPLDQIRQSLADFSLPERRFQVLYSDGRSLVVDDYAHHPTEIKATLNMLKKSGGRRIIAVFQPHRYTRLKLLMGAFARSFSSADRIWIAHLYSANQKMIKGVSGSILADEIRRRGKKNVEYVSDLQKIEAQLLSDFRDGDAMVFLSAGNLTRTAHSFARLLKEREA